MRTTVGARKAALNISHAQFRGMSQMADSPRSSVTVQVMSADSSLRTILKWMLDQHISHAEIPFGKSMFVHLAIVFDRVESSKLTVHLDKVTLAAIHKSSSTGE